MRCEQANACTEGTFASVGPVPLLRTKVEKQGSPWSCAGCEFGSQQGQGRDRLSDRRQPLTGGLEAQEGTTATTPVPVHRGAKSRGQSWKSRLSLHQDARSEPGGLAYRMGPRVLSRVLQARRLACGRWCCPLVETHASWLLGANAREEQDEQAQHSWRRVVLAQTSSVNLASSWMGTYC